MKTTYFKQADLDSDDDGNDIVDGWLVIRRRRDDAGDITEDTIAVIDTEELADTLLAKLREKDPPMPLTKVTLLLEASYAADEISDLDLASGLSDMIQKASLPKDFTGGQVLLSDLSYFSRTDFGWECISGYLYIVDMFMALNATANEIRECLKTMKLLPSDPYWKGGRTKAMIASYYANSVFNPERTVQRSKKEVHEVYKRLTECFGGK